MFLTNAFALLTLYSASVIKNKIFFLSFFLSIYFGCCEYGFTKPQEANAMIINRTNQGRCLFILVLAVLWPMFFAEKAFCQGCVELKWSAFVTQANNQPPFEGVLLNDDVTITALVMIDNTGTETPFFTFYDIQ